MIRRDDWAKVHADQEKRRTAAVGSHDRLTAAVGPAEVARIATAYEKPYGTENHTVAVRVRKIARATPVPGQQYDDFQRLCMADNVACPVREHRFHVERKWRFDYAWPDWYLAVEKEGGINHARGNKDDPAAFAHASSDGILRDMEKGNAAVMLGWRVLRYTPAQLLAGAVADVRRILSV